MYGLPAYFLSKITSEIPNFTIIPIFMSCITYFSINLNYLSTPPFFIFLFVQVSMFFNAGGLGMIIGSIVPNKQTGMSATPMVIVPFMLFAGFFVSLDNIPSFMIPLKYISLFKYALQAYMQNEYDSNLLNKLDCYPTLCNPLV